MEKKFKHNPRYQAGDSIRNDLRMQRLRRSYDINRTYNSIPVGAENYDYSTIAPGITDSQFFPGIDENGKIQREKTSAYDILMSPFRWAGHQLFGDYENAYDRFSEASIADAWRLFHEKRYQAETTNNLNKVSEAEQYLDQIKNASDYADNLDKLYKLRKEYDESIEKGDFFAAKTKQEEFEEVLKNVSKYENNIKTDGRNSYINVDLFYDLNKASSRETLLGIAKNLSPDLGESGKFSDLFKMADPNPLWDALHGFSNVANTFGKVVNTARLGIQNILESAESLVKTKGESAENRSNVLRQAILDAKPYDKWTENLFIKYSYDPNDKNNPNTDTLRGKIKPYKEYWERELESRKNAAEESAYKYKNGAWFFDPVKINPKFRQFSENNNSGLIGALLPDQILYSLAEAGSSYSDWVNMGEMALSDAGMSLLTRKLATMAVKRNPVTQAFVALQMYRNLKSAGRLREAASLEEKALNAEKLIRNSEKLSKGIETVGGSAQQMLNLYFINRMREHETNSEVIDAWSTRVLNNSMNRNADLEKVLDTTREYLSTSGVPVDKMTDIDLIQFALAYNIPTGDAVFENEKKQGRVGLKKVYNDNMALAAKDYAEVIPMLSFSGSFLRNFFRSGVENSVADRMIVRSFTDSVIDKYLPKLTESLSTKLKAKHTVDFLKKKLALAGYVSTMEGIEEGQQEMLQSRYARGVYDKYTNPLTSFNINDVIHDAKLASEAAAAYLGVLYGDPDNGSTQIKRAMQIGAAVGGIMGVGGISLLTNALPSTGYDNTRNLIAQIKNDNELGRVIAEAYGTAQDDKHLDIFYDAFQKHGINNVRLRKSLEDLKLFIPHPKEKSNINDKYVQRDIDLMERLWDSVNDSNLKTLLKGMNISPDSDAYRSVMKSAARYKLQSKDASDFVKQDISELDQITNSITRTLQEYMYGRSEDYYEDDVYIPKDLEIEKFINAIKEDYNEYKKQFESATKEREKLEEDIKQLEQHSKESRNDYDDDEVINYSEKLDNAYKKHIELSKYKDKTFDEYVEEAIKGLINYRFLQNAIDLHNKLQTKQQLLNELSEELGIDVSSTMMQSILNRIQDQIYDIEKDIEDSDVLTKNKLIRELNKSRKSGQKKLNEIPNISKRVLDKYGNIKRAEEIDHIQARMLLNRAVYDIVQPIARGFVYGEIDPRNALSIIEPLRWKSLSEEEKNLFIKKINEQRANEGKPELSKKAAILMWHKIQKEKISKLTEDSKKYEKLLHDSTSMDEDSEGENIDLKLARKEAFEHFIEYEIQNREELRRINHREFIRSNKSSIETQEMADDGDPNAKEVIQEIINKEDDQAPTIKPSSESQPTINPTNPSQQDVAQPAMQPSGTDITLGYDQQGEQIIQNPENRNVPINPPSDTVKEVLDILGVQEDQVLPPLPPNQEVETPILPPNQEVSGVTLPPNEQVQDQISIAEGIIEYETSRNPQYEPIVNRHTNEKSVNNNNQIYTDFLGQTFKYPPTKSEPPIVANIRRIQTESGIEEDVKNVIFKNNAKLGSGKELSKKLMIPGWFEKAEKYFVITVNENKGSAQNRDDLIVGMAIQDGDDVYMTFLQGLSAKDNVFQRMDQMFYSFFEADISGQKQVFYLYDQDKKFNYQNFLYGQFLARRSKYLSFNPGADVSAITETDIKTWYDNLPLSDKDEVDFAVRKFLSGGRDVFSNESIRKQIENVRNTRNQIIDACLIKDEATGEYILPENVYEAYGHIGVKNPRISDGSFNDVKEGGLYVFRKLLGDGFGIPEDATPEEITKLIESEEFKVGLGRGERAFEGSQYAIDKLDPDSTGNYNDSGIGLAGKLYYIAKTLSGRDRAVEISEKKFRDSYELVKPEDVEEAFDDSGKIIEGKIPTIAEFILRLVTDNIDDSVFDGISPQFISAFKEDLINILVNAGHRTWVKGRDEKKWQHFAQKQFFYDDKTHSLVISLPDRRGMYHHVSYKISDIYSKENSDSAALNRKIIISAISNNLHWNTDRYTLTQEFSPIFLESLKHVFIKNKDLKNYKIAGIDDLSFDRDDLFDKDLQAKHVNVLAWMIKTGKILTTKGDTLFKDPFVYADGPIVKTTSNTVEENKKQPIVENKKKKQNVKNKKQEQKEENPRISSVKAQLNENLRKSFDKILNSSPKNKDDEILDIGVLDVKIKEGNSILSDEEISKNVDDAINRVVDNLQKQNLKVDKDKISKPNSGEYQVVSSGNGVFISILFSDGSIETVAMSIDELQETATQSARISGVYSTEKHSGQLDYNSAKEWIKNTLGLQGHQVIVTNAIMKGVNNEDVYGVLNIAVDVLLGEYYGFIMFRKDAGDGIQYHEAFHYVNLLLNTPEQRNKIYKKFVELNPQFKGEKRSVLEERLADGFINYAQKLKDKESKRSKYGKLRKWLANLYDIFLDFIKSWSKKDVIEKLYNDIYSGKYAGKELDKDSLEEFKRIHHKHGVHMANFKASGFKQKDIENFKAIQNYQQLYVVIENVAHSFLEFANIIHAEDVQKISKSTINDFFESLKKKNRLKKNPYIQDVIDNPDKFMEGINTLLKQYGIIPKRRSSAESKNNENEDEKVTASTGEELQDLIRLYENYTVDAKTNAQFRAKLFLCQIKDSEFQYNENTEKNESVVKIDPETGLVKYVSFEEAWYLIVNSLHDIESYEDIYNEVYRRSKTKSFFAQLYKKLQSIEGDIQLQTQIFTTVSKHLTTVAQIHIKEQYKRRSFNVGEEPTIVVGASEDQTKHNNVTYDSDKTLEIINDNTLKARRMLPREWSKDLFASPIIQYDQFHHFDKKYVEMLKKKYENIVKEMQFDRRLTKDNKKDAIDKVFPELLKLLNLMSIPFDSDVLTEYIMIHVREQKSNTDSSESEQWYEALKEILSKPGSSTNKSANIAFFIYNIFNKKSSVIKAKKKDKEIAGVDLGFNSNIKLSEVYNGWGGEIDKMAIAYNNIHPSSREQMITGPGNVLVYPIGENNFMSDIIRWINKNHNDIINNMLNTMYAKHSKMLEVAKIIHNHSRFGELEFKLNVFVGMKDENTNDGEDYFGITSLEDMISKILMSHNNMIILPTMADKKTYYTIQLVNKSNGKSTSNLFELPHDVLLNTTRKFSNETLYTFAGYFYDELNSVIEYYNKENINNAIKNKRNRKKNFHGNVKNGKMMFGGNGGMFRYFYSILYKPEGEDIQANLNQLLEYEYNKQQIDIQDGEGASKYREDSNGDLDGFEGIRKRLQNIKSYYFEDNVDNAENNSIFTPKQQLLDSINSWLFSLIDTQIDKFSKPGIEQLIRKHVDPETNIPIGISNRLIPTQIFSYYIDLFEKKGIHFTHGAKTAYFKQGDATDLVLSVIGNFTVQQMISTIETEKIFSSDPAYYKWVYSGKDKITVNGTEMEVRRLVDKDSDKIKRLGALLSPGRELRKDFTEEEIKKYPWLAKTKYTNGIFADVKAKSIFLDELSIIIKKDLIADTIRSKQNKSNSDYGKINKIYLDPEYYKEVFNQLPEQKRKEIDNAVNQQINPFGDITVSDAQVLIRPDMYRSIRMRLGDWSVDPIQIKYKTRSGEIKTTSYSDNEAFEILENDPEWMSNPEKAAKVSKLQLYPLKMSYYKNDPHSLFKTTNVAFGEYNKMAIFPAFKYLMTSTTGKQIYERMNEKGQELDMITFESAVKVGLGNDIYSPYDEGTEDLSVFNTGLLFDSGASLNEAGEVSTRDGLNILSVEIQEIDGLRMQLNTEAHEDTERSIGTQMFKILFGNIYDDEDYLLGKDGRTVRKGKEIRNDIMKCIKQLTILGVNDIKSRFYTDNNPDKQKVLKYIKDVAKNNNISSSVLEILDNAGNIESLMQKTLFEHSVTAAVNRSVIDIVTPGGSAIQQSVFGFVSYGAKNVRVQQEKVDGFPVLNDGRELNWYEEDGSMEVMLSANFFRHIVPQQYQSNIDQFRQWLINHDIIKGFKKKIITEPNWGLFEIENLDKDLVDYKIVYEPWKDDNSKKKKVLKIWLKGEQEKGTFDIVAEKDIKNVKYTGDYAIHFKTNNGTYGDENVKPTTKEERSILFEQVAKVIPEGARISTRGSVSIGGKNAIDRIGQENGWRKAIGEREATSKETGEKINISIYVKPYSEKEKQAKNNLLDTSIYNISEFDTKIIVRLENAGVETLKDIVKVGKYTLQEKYNIDDDQIQVIEDVLDSLGMSFDMNTNEYNNMSKPKPFGVGYRIPTQGMSSTFAFTVADVLPFQSGDLIIVPREFTAQTGSDFDVDKLYLATLQYENDGSLKILGNNDNIDEADKTTITNTLIQNYIDVVTDIKTRANARSSIDVITDIIQNSTLKAIRGQNNEQPMGGYELTPYFQMQKKKEFSIGKSGIGPFALNTTNLALTQFAHITIDYTGYEAFGFGNLDEVKGRDGLRISDWLSAMVNAHVDVAKDPYIFDLNLNQYTYKFANFLIRAGMGESALLFLAQPEIKKVAEEYNNYGGIYGNFVEGEKEKPAKYKIIDNHIDKLTGEIRSKIDSIYKENQRNNISNKDTLEYVQGLWDVGFKDVFDISKQKESLKNPNELQSLIFQLICLKALKKIDPLAQELSDLVKMSRIDTKKFGNTLAQQRDFVNEYEKFKYKKRSVRWINTDGSSTNPLSKYFSDTFLDTKLYAATGLVRDILSTVMLNANEEFDNIVTTIFGEFFGIEKNVIDDQHNKLVLYGTVYKKEQVDQLSNAIENVLRHKLFLQNGPTVFNQITGKSIDFNSDSYDWNEIEKQSDYRGPIDFTFGGNQDIMNRELRRIIFGEKESKDPLRRQSIFELIPNIIKHLEKISDEKKQQYKGFIDDKNNVINELLLYLKPQPADYHNPIPTLLLKNTNRNTTTTMKNKLTSAFSYILDSDSRTLRRIGRDIAIYAYYSQYNMNTRNSFFDVVPPEYRLQYDITLSNSIDDIKTNGIIFDSEDIRKQCRDVINIMCRNFHNNDNVVPYYEIPSKQQVKSGNFKSSGYIIPYYIGGVPATILIGKYGNTQPPYIKIKVKSDPKKYVLYKATGYFSNTRDGDEFSGSYRWYLYTPVGKLGIHAKGFNQYEFGVDSQHNSIFDENELNIQLNKQYIQNIYNKFKQDSQKKIDKEYDSKTKHFVSREIVQFIKLSDTDVINRVKKDVHTSLDKHIIKQNIRLVENPESYIQNKSQIIVKSSDTNIKSSIQNQSDAITQTDISIGILQDTQINITDDDVKEAISMQIYQYKKDNIDYTEKDIEEYYNKLNENHESFIDVTKYVAAKRIINEILNNLSESSYNIKYIYVTGNDSSILYKAAFDSVLQEEQFEDSKIVLIKQKVQKDSSTIEQQDEPINRVQLENEAVINTTKQLDDVIISKPNESEVIIKQEDQPALINLPQKLSEEEMKKRLAVRFRKNRPAIISDSEKSSSEDNNSTEPINRC